MQRSLVGSEMCIRDSNNTRESFPPETATQTSSLFLIILCFDIVLAALCKIELEKQSEQSVSPEYFLVYAACF